ncbi:alpha-1,3-mannosyl-glycoprotein 4-beta-N-acetylglucosaminyltransferase B-like [Centruroides sculpturatus]|uniref:alpha-1,3-mannosyl-glycoprotein 4-beta-N-acetylglucosaminyltransferase B-like n=1 Tax=Centruroides sculpturatus TaxID=218467 RepID=UPI000C6DE0A9|nr:alpha-1,3-mannosyl-glycoprotein 4-beta-N-acetylglucosaminyltransferase B-like [Centruroides sculpturatus]
MYGNPIICTVKPALKGPAQSGHLTQVVTLAAFILIDLSEEQILQQKIAELQERLRHAEMLNIERRRDILALRENIGMLIQLADQPHRNNTNFTHHLGRETLWRENLLMNSRSLDLQLPSIHHFLPHLLSNPDGLQPSFKLSRGRTGATVVLGVPTVKRDVQSYLISTLQNLIDNMTPEEQEETLIIVFIAETDYDYVQKQATEIEEEFHLYTSSGLLEIISPPSNYYPDFNKLRQTLGDDMARVKWRTKQNLDFAYLMMYAQPRGTFYVQLEDDILSKPGYIGIMKNYAYKQLTLKKEWLILDFCQLGFIGKLSLKLRFNCFIIYDCKKQKDSVWLHYRPSLFQHVGTHSSLKGKVQKLKDKQFGKVSLHRPHDNPPAEVHTSLRAYKNYLLSKAYKGETFFWSLLPQPGDNVTFYFNPSIKIEKFLFRSGNAEHPDDKFFNTTVEILPSEILEDNSYPVTRDGYLIVGSFKDSNGVAEGTLNTNIGPIKVLRLNVHTQSDRWAILSEILIKPFGNTSETTSR